MEYLRKKLFPPLQTLRHVLENIEHRSSPPQLFRPMFSTCLVTNVYDGDTITVAACMNDNPNNDPFLFKVRMYGYDAAELRTKCVSEKQAAILTRDKLRELILNKVVSITIEEKNDKYGRVIGTVFDGTFNVNQYMCDHYGVPYDGGKKSADIDWSQIPRTHH